MFGDDLLHVILCSRSISSLTKKLTAPVIAVTSHDGLIGSHGKPVGTVGDDYKLVVPEEKGERFA